MSRTNFRFEKALGGCVLLWLFLTGCSAAASSGTATQTPGVIPDVLRDPVTRAKEHLSRELRLDPGQVELVSAEATEWPDASLGAPAPGKVYAQVITPGYRVLLRANGDLFEVHGDRSGRSILARDDRKPVLPAPYQKLRLVLAYLQQHRPHLALTTADQWWLEDSPAAGAVPCTWVWSNGPWSIEISGQAGKAASAWVTLRGSANGVAWAGRMHSDGTIVPDQETVGPEAQATFDLALGYFNETYPGFGLMQQPRWVCMSLSRVVPGVAWSGEWQGGSWTLLLSCPVAPRASCNVQLHHDLAGSVWVGTVEPGGQLVAADAVLLTVRTAACQQPPPSDGVAGRAGVEADVLDGTVTLMHRLPYVCCAQFALAAGQDGPVIKIVESNVGQVCRCMCDYVIDAELSGLKPGTYTVEVWGVQHVPVHPLELLGRSEVTIP